MDSHRRSRIRAALALRCPACRVGRLYAHRLSMNRRCPSCGIRFAREPGYFTGAIWVGFLIAVPLTLGALLLVFTIFPTLHPAIVGIVATWLFLPLLPMTLRFSRSLWMYFDHQIQPERNRGSGPDDGLRIDGPRPVPVGTGRTVVTSSGGKPASASRSR